MVVAASIYVTLTLCRHGAFREIFDFSVSAHTASHRAVKHGVYAVINGHVTPSPSVDLSPFISGMALSPFQAPEYTTASSQPVPKSCIRLVPH